MNLTFDLKTRELIAFSDILGYESNVNSDNIVYIDDHIVIGKYFVDVIETTFNKDTGLEEIVPGQYVLSDKQLERLKTDILRKELTQKASELIQTKKNELAENRDIGYLTEKFRIARNI